MPETLTLDQLVERGLRALSRRDHGARELERKLAREASPELAAAAIARLRELGYLDDARVAAARATRLLEQNRLGPAAVRRRLQAQGFAPSLIAQVMRDADEASSERERAEAFLSRHFPELSRTSAEADRVRAARKLASRGFDEDLIRTLLDLE